MINKTRSAMFCRTRCLPNPVHTVHVPFTLYGRLPQCVHHNSRPSTDGCVSHNVECSPLISMRSERAHERTKERTYEWTLMVAFFFKSRSV